MIFVNNSFANDQLIGGCVVGMSEVIKEHKKGFTGFSKDQLEAMKQECRNLISRSSNSLTDEETKARKDYPFESGCGTGAGAALRTLKGNKWYASVIMDNSIILKEMKKYCSK